MPTPVSAARRCLTDEAAKALDDAVAVARRRNHAQTTSVHAVSALLALPNSSLREACSRARSSAYSPRLQFRALELCVSVSLDRLPSSKSVEEPPISNSLMAAIKRSQANQRRHPESFHLHQIHSSEQNVSVLKVELKNFILSILDDPIVSRVFGDAGFRRCDIKLGIVHPPISHASGFSRTRLPPIFLCNWSDSDLRDGNFCFPYSNGSVYEDGKENSRRIGEVLVRKNGKNPLLVGVCASDALLSFVECVQRGKSGVLPAEVAGLNIFCIGKEISECMVVSGSDEKIGLMFEELNHAAENCTGPGIVVNFGELKQFIGDSAKSASVVAQLTSLLKRHCEKLWLIGVAGTHETYVKMVAQFPTVEKDWDIHLLQITSSQQSKEGSYPKSSLLGSFVPFGGFFSTPSDFKDSLSITNESFTRCHMCNEKYEQEVASILKVRSNTSVADQYSESISSWLKMAELETIKGHMAKTKDDETLLNIKTLGIQKKWNDICLRYHQSRQFPKLDTSRANSKDPVSEDFQLVGNRIQSSSKDSSLTESQCASLSPRTCVDLQKDFLPKQLVPIALGLDSESGNCNLDSKVASEVLISQQVEVPPNPLNSLLPIDCISSLSSLTSVTTDLGLGTLYASSRQEPNCPNLQHCNERLCQFSASVSADFDGMTENTSKRIASFPCSGANMEVKFDPKDFKLLRKALNEKIGWQDEAIFSISQAISRSRTRNQRHCDSNLKGNIWLTFLGHDKVGKKRTASALAETLFGNKGSLISLDLNSQDSVGQSDSIFECKRLNSCDVKFRGKTVVDYVAGELNDRPHSLVFLENVDKADLLVQSSLSQAIRTGKFPDSHGREITVKNMIFVATLTITEDNRSSLSGNELFEFSEAKVLGARNCQMQILVESVTRDGSRRSGMNVRVTNQKSNTSPSYVSKRKMADASGSGKWQKTLEIHKQVPEVPRSYLDLNLPVEAEEDTENSETWLEDFFNQVDEKVMFKPFNFDKLAEKLLNLIRINFQKTLGSEIQLAIDHEVMLQILAASWLSDSNVAMDEWIEQVLNRSFAEIQWRYHLNAESVLKLVHCEGTLMEDQASHGLCLPAKINVT